MSSILNEWGNISTELSDKLDVVADAWFEHVLQTVKPDQLSLVEARLIFNYAISDAMTKVAAYMLLRQSRTKREDNLR